MSNFLFDNTSLPANKVDLTALPGGASVVNYVRATEWNSVVQAIYDIRGFYNDVGLVDIKAYGAACNGGTDDYDALLEAIGDLPGATNLLIPGPMRIGTNISIPSNITLVFSAAGQLIPDAGVTITVLGGIRGGETQYFSGAGTVNTSNAIGIVSRGTEAASLNIVGKLGAASAQSDIIIRTLVNRTNGKLLSFMNNGVEVASIDYAGNYSPAPVPTLDPLSTSTVESLASGTLNLKGDRGAADAGTDVIITAKALRTNGKILQVMENDGAGELFSVDHAGIGTFAGGKVNLNAGGTSYVQYDGSDWMNFNVPAGDGYQFLVDGVQVGAIDSSGSASFLGILTDGDLSITTGIIKTQTNNTPITIRSKVTEGVNAVAHKLVSTNTLTEDTNRYLLDMYRTDGTGTPTYRFSSVGRIFFESATSGAGFTVTKTGGRQGTFRTAGGSGELFQLGGDGGGNSVTSVQIGPTALTSPEVTVTSSLLELKSGVTITGASSTSLQMRGAVANSSGVSAVKIGNSTSLGTNNDRWILDLYSDNLSTAALSIDALGGIHRRGSNQSLILFGNRDAADTGPDIVLSPANGVTRSNGYALAFQNGSQSGAIDWNGNLTKLATNGTLTLKGNRNAADTGSDILLTTTAIRTNGNIVDVQTNAASVFKIGFDGRTTIGNGGAPIAKVLKGSTTYDPPNLSSSGGTATTTVTVTGAVAGDPCFIGFSQSDSGVQFTAQVTSANTVTVRLLNISGVPVDMASGTLTAVVFQMS